MLKVGTVVTYLVNDGTEREGMITGHGIIGEVSYYELVSPYGNTFKLTDREIHSVRGEDENVVEIH